MTRHVDVRSLLDPEAAVAVAEFPIDFGVLCDETLPTIRAALAALPTPILSDLVERTEHVVPATDGVTLRVHRPIGVEGDLPCVYWMHGGGLVLGDQAQDDIRFDRWCQMLRCVGVSVGYRLAPETPYPGPLDDCYAGLQWVHDHAAELGADPARIGIGGDRKSVV